MRENRDLAYASQSALGFCYTTFLGTLGSETTEQEHFFSSGILIGTDYAVI